MIANSEINNENIGAVPNSDTVTSETFVNDKPEQINLDINKEATPKQDNAKDESPKNNDGVSKEDPNSSMSDTTGGTDIDENYFSVGYFLKKDGTSEEVRLHLSEMALDSDEESEEEDFDELNLPYHFAFDGSVQKLDLRKKSSKKTHEVSHLSKVRTYSLGNFLKRNGTLEEVTIPFDELESDSENGTDEEDLLEGISTTYHLGVDGCLRTLLEGKFDDKNKSDHNNKSSEDKSKLSDNDAPNEKNTFNDKKIINDNVVTINDKVITINKKHSSVGKNPFYDNYESNDKNTSDDKNPFDDNDEGNENTSDDKNPFNDNVEPNENTSDNENPFNDNDEPNDKDRSDI